MFKLDSGCGERFLESIIFPSLLFHIFLRTVFMCSTLSMLTSSLVLLLHLFLMYFRMSRIFRGNMILQFMMKRAISKPIQMKPHTSILLILWGEIKNSNIQQKNNNNISLYQFKKLLMLSLNGRYFIWYFQIQKNSKHKHTTWALTVSFIPTTTAATKIRLEIK